jgi:prefoldin subunit 5
MLKQIEKLEASNPLFEELHRFKEPDEVMEFIDKHRHMIEKLPADQKEMIDLLDERLKEKQTPMVVDLED